MAAYENLQAEFNKCGGLMRTAELRKLGFHNITDLVLYAVRNHLIEL